MIVAEIKAKIPPGRIQEALQLVRDIMGPTKARPGCAGISFYQDTDEPDTMVLTEEWEDRTNLEDHIRSESYRNILALMDLSTKAPKIKFNTISRTEGMEVIEEAKAGDSAL